MGAVPLPYNAKSTAFTIITWATAAGRFDVLIGGDDSETPLMRIPNVSLPVSKSSWQHGEQVTGISGNSSLPAPTTQVRNIGSDKLCYLMYLIESSQVTYLAVHDDWLAIGGFFVQPALKYEPS